MSTEVAPPLVSLMPDMSFARQRLLIKGSTEPICQFYHTRFTPIMQEHVLGLFMRHMIVDCHDINTRAAQGFQHGLQFRSGHRKIAIDERVVVCACKGGPSV